MELFVQLIFILALLKYCLKASLAGSFRTMLCYALAMGVWALAWYPLVILQPVTIIQEWLTNKKIVTDGAVLTSVEAILGVMVSIYLLDNYFAPKEERKKRLFVMKVLPGILALGGVLYFELMFFKLSVGSSFLQTALLYSLLCSVIVFILSFVMKRCVTGESLKLEMKLLLNLFILIVGLLVNSTVADYNASAAQNEVEWWALFAVIALALFFILVGAIAHKYSFKKLLKIKNDGSNN